MCLLGKNGDLAFCLKTLASMMRPFTPGFSTVWKTYSGFFHAMEKQAHFFHAMEKLSAVFPHNGKTLAVFSTQWEKFSGFFHTMEKMFPQCGKLGIRAVFCGFQAVLRGC